MYSSYKNLFTIKWKIYSIGDKALPRPMSLDSLGLFLLLLVPAYYLALPLAHILNQGRPLLTLLLDASATYLLMQYDPQGRPVFVYLWDLVIFLFGSGRKDLNGLRIPEARCQLLEWSVDEMDRQEAS